MVDVRKLMDEAQAFVDEAWEDVVADIDSLVQVESVEDKEHAAPGMPFGPAPREALDRALGIARRLGLQAQDMDGYMGIADLPGERERYVATIAHSDVVPKGLGWDFDPLRVTRKDGYLVGRGVIDDKGPLVLSLWAAHFWVRHTRQTGEPLPMTLRCLIGTNEETGMEDVEKYLERYPEPEFCFSPDAVFPLICGEKGRFYAEVASQDLDARRGHIVELTGGTVANAVPGLACAVLRDAGELPTAEGIQIEPAGIDDAGRPLTRVVAQGIGGHAAMPEGTRNAIGMIVDYVLGHVELTAEERAFLSFERFLFADTAGEALGVAATDDVFEPLTCVGGTIRTTQTGEVRRFVQTIDMRYPKSTTGERIEGQLQAVVREHGCAIVDTDDMVPFYMSPELPAVRALADTYGMLSGNDATPITIGGGTYARHFKRAVAFGPDDPLVPPAPWVGQEHGPNEGVSEDALRRALVIYIVAIARLMEALV